MDLYMASIFFPIAQGVSRESVGSIPMERTSVPYLLEGMERAWFHTYGTNLVPYLPTQVAFPKGILKGIPKGY